MLRVQFFSVLFVSSRCVLKSVIGIIIGYIQYLCATQHELNSYFQYYVKVVKYKKHQLPTY